MIISRALLSFSLAGGGTDIKDHYGTDSSLVMNFELRLTRKLNIQKTFPLWLHTLRYLG